MYALVYIELDLESMTSVSFHSVCFLSSSTECWELYIVKSHVRGGSSGGPGGQEPPIPLGEPQTS